MTIAILTLAAGLAAAPPAAAPPATAVAPAVPIEKRTLASLPDTTVKYYDVPGRTGPAIEKSLKGMMANPAMTDAMRPYNWNVGAQVSKQTTGPKCSVVGVKSKLTSTVNLPRLVDLAKVDARTVTSWNAYVTSLENDAASNLWFVSDRLPAIERSLANLPCDKVAEAWNAGLEQLKTQQVALARQLAAANAATKTATKKDGSPAEVPISGY